MASFLGAFPRLFC